MKITVDSKLRISDISPELQRWCKENLVIDNPDFYKKQSMGKWVGNTPKTIQLFEIINNEWWLPFGCLRDVWQICGKGASWEAHILALRSFNYGSNINLYEYQEKAVKEALKAKNGILVMPCGSGKTQCGLEIISRIGGRALWLTHTQDLLNQSKDRAKCVLDEVGAGTITAGKINLGVGITFATVQTMAKIDLSQLIDYWDIIIVDECQRAAGSPTKVTQFYKVLSNLNARYKIGLTATPKRADGLERSMFALLGGKIHEITRAEVKSTTCKVIVTQIPTGWMPDYDCVLMGDGTIDYNKVVEALTHDEERYQLVLGQIGKLWHGPTLVLANRVEYLQRLCDDYNNGQFGDAICLSGMSQSKAAKAKRKAALKALNDGEIDCIFATYQLAKEGLDVPNLRYVVLATPEKDETTVIQSVGRVGRKAEDKKCGRVIDYVDDFAMYRGWAKKRQGYYKKIEAEVVE
jgi:superfamily II DNA or RNA helicase